MKYSVYVRRYEKKRQARRLENTGEALMMAGFMAAMAAGCFADAPNLTVFMILEGASLLLMAAGGFLCGMSKRMKGGRG